MKQLLTLFAAAMLGSVSAHAAAIFAPGDAIFGGRSDGTNFVVGAVGTDGGNNVYTDNVWPMAEATDRVIDGAGQKYLNFAELNTGFIVTPNFNGGLGSVADSIKLWTANDSPGRDPATYELYGTNAVITGAGPFALSQFTLISAGALSLPATRNLGGTNPLLEANSQTVSFANGQMYRSYLVLFPTIKDEPASNSMQVAEVQVFGNVPEPGSIAFLSLAGILAVSRRRRS